MSNQEKQQSQPQKKPRPICHVMVTEYLRQLREAGGVPTDEEVIQIYKYSEQATRVSESSLLRFQCREVGNIVIYPLTIGAKLFLEDIGEWYAGDDDLQYLAYIYACMNSRDKEAFDFRSPSHARHTIRKVCRRVRITGSEFEQAIEYISRMETGDHNESDLPFVPYISLLVEHMGKDIDHWLWNIADEIVSDLIRAILKRAGGARLVEDIRPTAQAAVDIVLLCNKIKERAKHGG